MVAIKNCFPGAGRRPSSGQGHLELVESRTMAEPAGQPAVLIVDDDALVRAILTEALKDEGYRLVEARDGEEAVARLRQEGPSVVLLDLFMPKKSGLEALAEIRGLAPACQVLII